MLSLSLSPCIGASAAGIFAGIGLAAEWGDLHAAAASNRETRLPGSSTAQGRGAIPAPVAVPGRVSREGLLEMLSAGLDPDDVTLEPGVRLDGLAYGRDGSGEGEGGWTCEVDCTGAGTSAAAATASGSGSGRRHATTLGRFDVVVGADGLVSTSRRTMAAVAARRGGDARPVSGVALIGDARRELGAEWDLGLSRVGHRMTAWSLWPR